jgi:hypothetical protein
VRTAAAVRLLFVVLLSEASVHAHEFAFTDVHLKLRADGNFVADVTCDADALAMGVASSPDSASLAEQIDALDAAAREELVVSLEELLKRRLRVRFDGTPAPFDVSLPERSTARAADSPPSSLGHVARLSGRVPTGARDVTFFASRSFPPVRLRVTREGMAQTQSEVLQRGEESRSFPLAGGPGEAASGLVVPRFMGLGFSHILPKGLDHILFVIGLALLSPRLKPLLAQVTAFTLAHTFTLGLSTYGVLWLSPRVVEPLIALSIVYVAVENLLTSRLRPARLVLVFAFGLLHGLGFAGALTELGWPEGRRLLALLAFNAGVELGQLAVIGLLLLLLAVAARAGVAQERIVRPVSLLIAAAGLYWALERLDVL